GAGYALIGLHGTAQVKGSGAVGERPDVFSGLPWAIILPPNTAYRLTAQTDLELAVVSAPAEPGGAPRVIRPADVRVETRGKGVTERRIRWILSEKDPGAGLLLVEVRTPAGPTSTAPP